MVKEAMPGQIKLTPADRVEITTIMENKEKYLSKNS
jgi:hypothetical protein